jgi:sirohydrochlorin cobaltochelatase
MKPGLILFAHGSRDPRWAEPFESVRAALSRTEPGLAVRLAYLEFMAPTLDDAADALVAEGCTRLDVLPLFLGTGGHLRRDLPPMVQAVMQRHPSVQARLHPAAGEAPALVAAMAEHALSLARS